MAVAIAEFGVDSFDRADSGTVPLAVRVKEFFRPSRPMFFGRYVKPSGTIPTFDAANSPNKEAAAMQAGGFIQFLPITSPGGSRTG